MPAPRKQSPSSPATDPAPGARQPPAGTGRPGAPALTRAEALRWWRAGYQAGHQAAEHQQHATARWDRLVASFRAQRAADQQAKLDALLLEAIAALASLFSSDDPA